MNRRIRDLFSAEAWQRQLSDRFSEPFHLQLISAGVALFGTFRAKVAFDLVRRRPFAFSMLWAADRAAAFGHHKIWILEFGVAPGTGLLNMCRIAERVTAATGVAIEYAGFDTGTGMPAPRDYRDHPERYAEGDFPMDRAALEKVLPRNARIIYGDIAETALPFIESTEFPVGFVAIDVDYYWSTVAALRIFDSDPAKFLPLVPIYFDDIRHDISNPWCGELLAIGEFNSSRTMRKISPFNFLRNLRIKKNASWIDQVYVVNFLDHPLRSMEAMPRRAPNVLVNPYLNPGV